MNDAPIVPATNDSRTHVVFITHGIFSEGPWITELSRAVEEHGAVPKGLRYPTVYLFQFWIPAWIGRWMLPGFSRESSLQHLLNEILAYPPDKYRVSFIAHSFGTWLVSEILRRYPHLKVNRVAFVGCIVKESFPWHEIIGRNVPQNAILNNVGTKDIWPPLANAATWGYGPTGSFGFGKAHIEDRFHNVGHSDLLTYEFGRDYLAPFLTNGAIINPTEPRRTYKRTSFLNFLRFAKWIALILICWWTVQSIRSHSNSEVPRATSEEPRSATSAPPELHPDWKTWDKLIDPIKPGEGVPKKLQARLDKWRTYVAKGAQPWLFNSPNGVPQESDIGFGWFALELAPHSINTFSYVFQTSNRNLAVTEVYAFLVHNSDSGSYAPVYRQLKPTVEKNLQEIEISQYQSNQTLLCFVLVSSKDQSTVNSDPSSWGIWLRRK